MTTCSTRTADGRYAYWRTARSPSARGSVPSGLVGLGIDEALPSLPADAVPAGEGENAVGVVCQSPGRRSPLWIGLIAGALLLWAWGGGS